MASRNRQLKGFTLLEVILAISLTGVLLLLLTTTLDLLLYRVDTSRSRVESAQLARSLSNLIAEDLRAARYYSPTDETATAQTSASTSDEQSAEGEPAIEFSSSVLGVYGTATQLRIDRAAAWRWERVLEDDSSTSHETTPVDDMPQTVRYFFNESERLRTEELAAQGVGDQETPADSAGLYCEKLLTAARIAQAETADVESPLSEEEHAELLAPEVVDLTFAYYGDDNKEALDSWDSAERGGLPRAVEITMKFAKERPENSSKPQEEQLDRQPLDEDDTIQYRLLVRLPKLQPRIDVAGPRRVEPLVDLQQ